MKKMLNMECGEEAGSSSALTGTGRNPILVCKKRRLL
jgi:hypothetical protein